MNETADRERDNSSYIWGIRGCRSQNLCQATHVNFLGLLLLLTVACCSSTQMGIKYLLTFSGSPTLHRNSAWNTISYLVIKCLGSLAGFRVVSTLSDEILTLFETKWISQGTVPQSWRGTFHLQPPKVLQLQPISHVLPGSWQPRSGAEAERTGAVAAGLGAHTDTVSPCRLPASANTSLLTGHSLHAPVQSQTWKLELHCRWLTLFKAICLTVLKALKTLRWAMKAHQNLGPCVVTAPANTQR